MLYFCSLHKSGLGDWWAAMYAAVLFLYSIFKRRSFFLCLREATDLSTA